MSDKRYMLIGNGSLRDVVDLINLERTESDAGASQDLIKEKKSKK